MKFDFNAEISSVAAAVGTTTSYLSLGNSITTYVSTGGEHGGTDLLLDLFGVGVLKYAGNATGLSKAFWYGTDIVVNTIQGFRGAGEA